jgi:hypothetical protein
MKVLTILVTGVLIWWLPQPALGQGYGTDAQNVLTPAAGGMAGVSIALPQDVPAALFGNPATLAQFKGTQFTLGGAWVASVAAYYLGLGLTWRYGAAACCRCDGGSDCPCL